MTAAPHPKSWPSGHPAGEGWDGHSLNPKRFWESSLKNACTERENSKVNTLNRQDNDLPIFYLRNFYP
jgi:hypothetical protein